MKTSYLVMLLCLACTTQINGQVINAKSGDFDEMASRPLIIELREMDPKRVEFLDKKIAKANSPEIVNKYTSQKEAYQKTIDSYNKSISKAVEKFFKLHDAVSIKSASEVEEIKKSESTEYTILYYSDYEQNGTSLTIPTLNYSRIETADKKVDYRFFLPFIGHRIVEGDEQESIGIAIGDFAIVFKMIQKHIAGIKSSTKKKYPFSAYAKDQAKNNCAKKSDFPLNLDERMIRKKESQAKLSNAYPGTIKLIPSAALLDLIENERDELIALSLPLRIFASASTGSSVSITSASIKYMKCFVNAKTGEIYAASGENSTPYYGTKNVQKLADCN